MASGRWRFEVTNLDGTKAPGDGVGVLAGASQRSIVIPYNGMRTFTFTIPFRHPRATRLLRGDCLVKGYRLPPGKAPTVDSNWRLAFIGEPQSFNEQSFADASGGPRITFVCADPLFRLLYRLLGMGVDPDSGKGLGYALAGPTAQIDLTVICGFILAEANTRGYTGIDVGSSTLTGTLGYFGPVYAKKAGEALAEVAALLGGPDFEVEPVEPSGAWPATNIGLLNLYASQGTTKPNVLFEYGTGKRNCTAYSRSGNNEILNAAFGLPPGFPDAPAMIVPAGGGTPIPDPVTASVDLASVAARGYREDVVSTDLATVLLRQKLCDEYIRIRGTPREQVFFTPAGQTQAGVPDPGADYWVGDRVTARADVDGELRVNGTCRVYGLTFNPDDQGAETVEVGLVPGE